MERFRSRPVGEKELPPRLHWLEEPPRPDYRVRLAFAHDDDGRDYRRLTFPDGFHLYAELIPRDKEPVRVR